MNDYEAKQEARKERYEELAEKNRNKSRERFNNAHDQVKMIPFGQPILVGHHSEGKHRNALKRQDASMRKGFEHQDKAEYYDNKAAGVGKAGISSDDPEALTKLKAKLETLQENQEYMKRINRIHRAYKKNPASIEKHDLTEAEIKTITTYEPEYSFRTSPFAPYQMQS